MNTMRLALISLLLTSLCFAPMLHADSAHKARKNMEKSSKNFPGRDVERRLRAVVGKEAGDTLREIYQRGVEQATTAPVTAAPRAPTAATGAAPREPRAASTSDTRPAGSAARAPVSPPSVPAVGENRDDAAFAREVDALFAEALDGDLEQDTRPP